jgi:hypothetical protein
MNDRRDQDRLLNDILAEPGATGAREALLGRTLRLAKRRRFFRQARRAAPALALVAAALLVFWHSSPPRVAQREPPKPYALIQTQALPQAALVNSRPLSPGSVVLSTSTAASVSTAAEPRSFQEIDDATLLSLAAPNSPVLVRLGPHTAELVFAQPPGAEPRKSETQ